MSTVHHIKVCDACVGPEIIQWARSLLEIEREKQTTSEANQTAPVRTDE